MMVVGEGISKRRFFTVLVMAKHDFSDFYQKLKLINLRLKEANLPVSIARKGASLYARATLPPPPASDKAAPYQQHLKLGMKANLQALKRAEATTTKIGAALLLKEFRWSDYGRGDKQPAKQTAAAWCKAFEVHYFESTERNPTTEGSFKNDYLAYLKRLPQDQALTRERLEGVIKATKPNSCQRAKSCSTFKRFGLFAGIDVTFIDKALRGTYSPFKTAPRDLPSAQVIVEWWSKIPNRGWRWVYGMLATYGLRPHEVFHLDTQELERGGLLIKVLDGTKTGYREVCPLYPEWVEQLGLRQKQLPNVTGKTNSAWGKRVTQAFRRYHIPFPAYNLRHCYAVRCIEFDINVSIAARWLGHSVLIHTRTYQAWLSQAVEQAAFERALNRPNRPQPPLVQGLEQPESAPPTAA